MENASHARRIIRQQRDAQRSASSMICSRQDGTKLQQLAGAGNDPNCPANAELMSQKQSKSRKVNRNLECR